MAVTINDLRNLGPTLKGHQFELSISPLYGEGNVEGEEINIKCSSTSMPGVSVGSTQIQLHAVTIQEHTISNFSGSWNFAFYDNQEMRLYRKFRSWITAMHNPWDNLSSLDEYKSRGIVHALDAQGNRRLTMNLYGVWPSNISDLSFGSNTSPFNPSVSLSYDYCEIGENNHRSGNPVDRVRDRFGNLRGRVGL